MGTRCNIALAENNAIYYICCAYDGYPQHVGVILNKYYNDINKVRRLILLGDIPHLLESVKKTSLQRYELSDKKDSECWNSTIKVTTTTKALLEPFIDCAYLFKNGTWLYMTEEGKLQSLSNVLHKIKAETRKNAC